jgi:hypothetical protein
MRCDGSLIYCAIVQCSWCKKDALSQSRLPGSKTHGLDSGNSHGAEKLAHATVNIAFIVVSPILAYVEELCK